MTLSAWAEDLARREGYSLEPVRIRALLDSAVELKATPAEIVTAAEVLHISPDAVGLSVRDVRAICDVSERTVRRHVKAGKLIPETINGPRGEEYRFPAPQVAQLFSVTRAAPRAMAPVQELGASVSGVGADVQALTAAIVALTQTVEEQQKAFTETLEAQSKTIDDLRHEQRDARAEIHQLQDKVLRALPARTQPRPWWQFWKPKPPTGQE